MSWCGAEDRIMWSYLEKFEFKWIVEEWEPHITTMEILENPQSVSLSFEIMVSLESCSKGHIEWSCGKTCVSLVSELSRIHFTSFDRGLAM